MRKSFSPLFILAICLAASACGKSDQTTATADPLYATASTAADEAADAIVEQTSATGLIGGSLMETETTSVHHATLPGGAFAVTRACQTGTSTTTVTETFSGSETKTMGGARLSVEVSISASGSQTRTWTPATGQNVLACNDQNRAEIDWASAAVVNGLRLDINANRTLNRSKVITHTVRNTTKSKTDNVAVAGTRTIIWATGTSDATTTTRTKTITSSVTRTRTFTDPNGVEGTITTTVATKSGADLNVSVKRDSTSKELIEKKINSGTLVATNASGIRMECSFTGVTFDMTSSTDRCRPTTGSISCDVYDSAAATTKTKTVLITFGTSTDSGISIVTDGGTAEDFPDYNTRGCDLEKAT